MVNGVFNHHHHHHPPLLRQKSLRQSLQKTPEQLRINIKRGKSVEKRPSYVCPSVFCHFTHSVLPLCTKTFKKAPHRPYYRCPSSTGPWACELSHHMVKCEFRWVKKSHKECFWHHTSIKAQTCVRMGVGQTRYLVETRGFQWKAIPGKNERIQVWFCLLLNKITFLCMFRVP